MQTCDLFSSRETIDEAYAYSEKLIETFPAEIKGAAYTALWVTLNTCLQTLEKQNPLNTPTEETSGKDKKLTELSAQETLTRIRAELGQLAAVAWVAERLEHNSLGELLGRQCAIQAHLFGLSVDEFAAEVVPHLQRLAPQLKG